jgi:uncharacterized protein (DUF433 family)
MNAYDMIETKPEVMLGKPVIKGTRIPVDLIVRKLGEGASFEDLLDGYPNLSRDAIQAALNQEENQGLTITRHTKG